MNRAPRPAMPLSPIQAEHHAAILAKLDAGKYRLEEVPACICGSAQDQRIADADRYGLPVGVVLCMACGLARTTPRLATESLPAFYEYDYHGLHQGVSDPDPDTALFRRGQGTAIHAFLADLLPPRPLRVADIGAGTGQVLREFQEVDGREMLAVGCEYSAAFVEAGKRAGSDIRHGGPETLAAKHPYDVVILSHVVEHFPNPVEDLAAVRALGHPKTLFYVEVPGLFTIDQKPEYAYRLEQYLTLAHTFHFTRDSLTATMWRAGFGIFRGDEAVRSVFIQAPAVTPRSDPALASRILASLERLDSWPNRIRRLRPRARQLAATTAKRLLPQRAVAAIRARR